MSRRFDEIELDRRGTVDQPDTASAVIHRTSSAPAGRINRLLTFATDVSLFVALVLALTPYLPHMNIDGWKTGEWLAATGIAGFVLLFATFYFVGCWVIWGKTIGGAIFDVKISADDGTAVGLKAALLRWLAVLLSCLTAGIGFALALLPGRRSLPDRLSATRAISG